MELKEGMYVRTKYGISQYKQHKVIGSEDITGILCKDGSRVIFANIEDIIGEPSFNIIDLIEVGDYVNDLRVEKSKYGELYTSYTYMGGDIGLQEETYTTFLKDYEEDYIYSIVTKEQFSAMEYKVGE